jgi:hypothetical protein
LRRQGSVEPKSARRTPNWHKWFLFPAGLGAARWALTVFGSLWPPERRLSAHADVFSRHLDAILSWVGLETRDMQTPYAVDVTGGSRNSAMSRKISANKFLGIATSVI